MGEGVRVHADQLGDLDLFVDQRRGVQQLTQPNVLLGQCRQLLQATLQEQGFGLEFFVFGDQLCAAAELAGDALIQTLRQVDDPVGLHEHHRHLAAHGLEDRKAGVDNHQRNRQNGQHQQTYTQRRAF